MLGDIACYKGKRSEAVMNMYKDELRASTTLRISLSYMTLPSEISEFLESFDRHYNELINLK